MRKVIKCILILYFYIMFFQYLIKNSLGNENLELIDEVLIVFAFFLFILSRLKEKKNISGISYLIAVFTYFLLITVLNNCKLIVTILSIRDIGIIGIIFYLIINNMYSIKFINFLIKNLIVVSIIEIICILFQIKKVLFVSPDFLTGSFGPGGAHILGLLSCFAIIIVIVDYFYNYNILKIGFKKNIIILLISNIIFISSSFRTLFLLMPILILFFIIIAIHSSNNLKTSRIRLIIVILLIFIFSSILYSYHNSIKIRKSYYSPILWVKQQYQIQTGGRLLLLLEGLDTLNRNDKSVFLGLGPGSYGSRTNKFLNSSFYERNLSAFSRSQYFITIIEIGIFGFLISIFFYVKKLAKFMKYFYSFKEPKYLYSFLCLILFMSAGLSIMIFEIDQLLIVVQVIILSAEKNVFLSRKI
ncbi:MAG: hypothetical protein ACTSQP_23605 [Promethearchaeota archaeon]